jgi:hypothetical protein
MNKDQKVHIAMINSFNVITGKASLEDVLDSGITLLAHAPADDLDYRNIELIILYFESVEMFEHCSILKEYLAENYNEDKTIKYNGCECDMPDIQEYTDKVKCSVCNKRIII